MPLGQNRMSGRQTIATARKPANAKSNEAPMVTITGTAQPELNFLPRSLAGGCTPSSGGMLIPPSSGVPGRRASRFSLLHRHTLRRRNWRGLRSSVLLDRRGVGSMRICACAYLRIGGCRVSISRPTSSEHLDRSELLHLDPHPLRFLTSA